MQNNPTTGMAQLEPSQITAICPVCKYDSIAITDAESGEIICNKCGIVISERVEELDQQQRIFPAGEINRETSTGAPSSLARHDRGLYTVIGDSNRDASGIRIDSVTQSRMQRIRKWDYRTQVVTGQDKSLQRAFVELGHLKDRLQLSDAAVEKTAYLYRKARQKRLVHGRTISGMLLAGVYIACRELGMPRTLKEIATATNNKVKEISQDYRLLYFKLDLRVPNIDPLKYVSKIASKVGLSEIAKRHAANMLNNIIKEEKSAGKNPMVLAATVLYLAGVENHEKVTQGFIARAAGIREVTLRKVMKDLNRKYK